MNFDPHVPGIASVIQLSIAPVFLLTSICALLGVLTTRLARAIDRSRRVEDKLDQLSGDPLQAAQDELRVLSRRARLVNRAITFATASALLICLVIAALFAGAFVRIDLSLLATGLFVLGVLALTLALIAFLREIFMASRHLRIGTHRPGLF